MTQINHHMIRHYGERKQEYFLCISLNGANEVIPHRVVSLEAGKLFLKRMNAIVAKRESFAFETTLSGLNYIEQIKKWKKTGYEVILYYLSLPDEKMAVRRVPLRVAQGGHNVPVDVIKRRYHRGWKNFLAYYRDLVDTWVVFDNSGNVPLVVKEKP